VQGGGGTTELLFFKVVCVPKTKEVIRLVNKVLVNLAVNKTKQNGDRYQPNTLETFFKMILSSLTKLGCPVTMKDIKSGFEGCLGAVLADLWVEEADTNPSFGAKPTRAPFTDKDEQYLRDYVASGDFDLSKNIQKVVQFGHGSQLLIRGRDELKNLNVSQVSLGFYGPEMGTELCCCEYVEISGLLGKTNKIVLGMFCYCVSFVIRPNVFAHSLLFSLLPLTSIF
jgi:hypothetical protein